MPETVRAARPLRPSFYNTVWRWHFYAGLFCIPMVIWLALTGTIYLWRPQIEAWLDRGYDHLAIAGPATSPDAQIAAALHAVPGAAFGRYVVPERPGQAVRILVSRPDGDRRVYVDPRGAAVLGVVPEEKRPLRVIFHLHGELLAGATGSFLVEIAACWAVVMILTGLYLWWPRGRRGAAGVLYPRLRGGGRLFWRDIHATTGLWVSLFGLGLILTGLPWAKAWGGYLGEIRQLTGTANGPVDWTIGGKAPAAIGGEHAGHMGMAIPARSARPQLRPPIRPGELARVIAAARPWQVAAPVLVSPPAVSGGPWTVASDSADRPLRSELRIDGASGRIVSHTGFAQRHWIDRTIGYGIAAHEGALFGLANQIAGTIVALALALMAVSGAILWWRRRPTGLLGAPLPLSRPRYGAGLVAIVLLLAAAMPMFGATLLLMLAVERLLLRHLPKARIWLGLDRRRGAYSV